MKFLVLGATGFLGTTLLGHIEKANYTGLGTSRYADKKSTVIKLDITDKYEVEHILKEYLPDIVVWTLLSMEEEDKLISSGLTPLLSVIREKTKLVFISTDAVFTDGKGGYTESDKPRPIPEQAPLATYVNSKIIGEKKVQDDHSNHIIIRTGPLYGKDLYQNIEQRTQKVLRKIEKDNYFRASANLYKTFVHVEDLSEAIIELSSMDFRGVLHAGPLHKESYFTFYKQRIKSLGYDESLIKSHIVNPFEQPHLPLDTSLNTQKASRILKTQFRCV